VLDDDAVEPPRFAGTRVEEETTPPLARLVLTGCDIGDRVSLGGHHAAGAAVVPEGDALTRLRPMRRTCSEQEQHRTYPRPFHEMDGLGTPQRSSSPILSLARSMYAAQA
jgi:hypothetical protein